MPCRVGWSFVKFDPRERPAKYIFLEDVHEEDVGEQEEVSEKEENQVDYPFIGSHPMLHIDDDLVLDIPYVVMDNPFNDSKGQDTNYDIDEYNIELDEARYQYNLDM